MFEIPVKTSDLLKQVLKKINLNSSIKLQLKQHTIRLLMKDKVSDIPFIFSDKLSSYSILPIINYIKNANKPLMLISTYLNKSIIEQLFRLDIIKKIYSTAGP